MSETHHLNGGDDGTWEGHLREHALMRDAHADLHAEVVKRLEREIATAIQTINDKAKALDEALRQSSDDHRASHRDQHDQSEKALGKIEQYAEKRSDETYKRFEAAIQSHQEAHAERDKTVDGFIQRNEGKAAGQAPFLAIGLSVLTTILAAAAVILVLR